MAWLSHINDELLAQFDLPPCVSRGRIERLLPPRGQLLARLFVLIALKLVGDGIA